MIHFESDYIEGAHEEILKKLAQSNYEGLSGYGTDPYTKRAKDRIREACGVPDAEVVLLTGGTQTNAIVTSMMLQPWEGVIAASSAHISLHEAGAVEAAGHKVLELAQHQGKLDAKEVEEYVSAFYEDENHPHMVYPGMVYISYPTELGTLYTKKEMEALAAVCRKYQMTLFLDGARLGYGLMSSAADLTLYDIAQLCDVFYIGGTKVGALCGEALVFTKRNMPSHMTGQIKQKGALLAKGWLLGVQFDTLFTDELYFKISRRAIEAAEYMKKRFLEKGYELYLDSPTNQQFVIFEDSLLEKLKEQVAVCFWEKVDDKHTAVRLATSWATDRNKTDRLFDCLEKIEGGKSTWKN